MTVKHKIPRPLGTFVLIKEDDPEEKSEGGIILTHITHETQVMTTGVVLGKGDGYWDSGVLIDLPVEVGDRVLFQRMNMQVWKESGKGADNQTYFFVPAGNIVAVI